MQTRMSADPLFRRMTITFLLLVVALPAAAIKVKDLSAITIDDVAGTLTGPGATITNIKITGANESFGTFTEGDALGIPSGVILSSGKIADAVGPNNSTGAGADFGGAGSDALDAIVAPFETHDATVLEFDVVTESPTFAIRYVFASEEYLEYVGSEFNDVFAFFVNGTNIALAPGTVDPVTINTINPGLNAGAYRDNGAGGSDTQFDGFTTVLTAVAILEPGRTNHIRIAIADTSDGVLDSAVIIAQGGVSGVPLPPALVPDENPVVLSHGEPRVVTFTVYNTVETLPANFSATGLGDATFTFSPLFRDAKGLLKTNMTINAGPNTQSGTQNVTIRSVAGSAELLTTLTVIVECRPPFVLGFNEPQSTSVTSGQRASLKIVPEGSGPFRIQWYEGFRGMTRTPVTGGTNATLETPTITQATPFWARVTNACGTYDSATAFVSPR